jgi:hypothetical protein
MTLREGFGELRCTYSHISLPPASNGQLNLPEHMSSMKNLFVEQDGSKAKRAVAQLHYNGPDQLTSHCCLLQKYVIHFVRQLMSARRGHFKLPSKYSPQKDVDNC